MQRAGSEEVLDVGLALHLVARIGGLLRVPEGHRAIRIRLHDVAELLEPRHVNPSRRLGQCIRAHCLPGVACGSRVCSGRCCGWA